MTSKSVDFVVRLVYSLVCDNKKLAVTELIYYLLVSTSNIVHLGENINYL